MGKKSAEAAAKKEDPSKNKKGKAEKEAKKNKEVEEEEKPKIEDIEVSIQELREKGKDDPENVDYVLELRKIQDQISDLKGERRRPETAKPTHSDDSDDNDDGEEEEEEDPDKEIKELINRRLTTCMLLALGFESEDQYPVDFYEKLNDSKKFKEVTAPITKEELKILNQQLKEKRPAAKKRMEQCGAKSK